MSQDNGSAAEPAATVMPAAGDASGSGDGAAAAAVDAAQAVDGMETAAKAAPRSNRKKRSRRGSRGGKNAVADPAGEDINLHVEAGWSEDDRDDKEPPAKRVAASAGDGVAAVAAVADSVLEDFTIRAVVTRKDVDTVFGHDGAIKDSIEGSTGAAITIVAGYDDPEIVVDRVLSVKGHIDHVAAAYRVIADALLGHSDQAAPTAIATAASVDADMAPEHDTAAGDTKTSGHAEAAAGADEVVPEGAGGDAGAEAGGTDNDAAGDRKLDTIAEETPADSTAERAEATSHATLRMLVPHKCVGSVMGHGGRTINSIRETANIEIHTSESTLQLSDERIVELVGTPASIQKAIVLIAEALTKDIAAYNIAEHYVPAANVPSAMTVETQGRKRKESRRQGPGDRGSGSRGHGSRAGGPRGSNGGSSASGNGGYAQGRGYSGSGGSQRSGGNGGGMGSSGGRGDRYSRTSSHGSRQGGRHRGPGALSDANRIPVGNSGGGGGGGGNSSGGGGGQQGYLGQYGGGNSSSGGGGQQGYPSHYGSGNDSYRGTGQPGGMRPAAPAAMSYAGYAMPTAMYPAYAAQGAVGGTHGGHYGGNYGGNMASMTGASSVGAYGSAYGAAAAQYQFATPAAYGYATAPMQGMYGSRAGNPAAAYTPRAYGGYGASPQMPQQSPSGGAGGSVDAMGQTVQQIYVPSDRIGAVIGRRGETINEIRRVTCARVDIKDSAPGAQERLVVITGQYEQVHTAYGMIKDKAYSAQQSTRPDMGHM